MKLALRVLAFLALVGVAVVHLKIAGNYKGVGKDPLSLPDQFYAQSAVAILLGVALIAAPRQAVWAASLLFGLGSLSVLVYSRYKALPVYGFPPGFQESWHAEGAKLAAVFEGVTIALSFVGLAITRSDD
ncbi:MAG: hypothetical protein JWO22_3183 [Frankiales bacterium]|nr:hypothetical protein [Frankiales bacterium]